MKKIFTLSLLFVSSFAASAQTFTPEQAAGRIGDSIKICGKIYGGRFFETSKGSPTLLNMGAAYPASPITIMIPAEVRTQMGYAPELQLKDKNICVKGRVVLYKEKPEVIIYDASQIEITP